MLENFANDLLETVKSYLPTGYTVVDLPMQGAFAIKQEDSDIGRVFYNGDCYRLVRDGMSMERVARDLVGTFFRTNGREGINIEAAKSFDIQKDHIAYKVVPKDKYSADMLSNIPHKYFFDLPVVCYCIVSMDREGMQSFVVSYPLCEYWGIDDEDLFALADKNTPKLLPLQISTMMDVLLNPDKDAVKDLEAEIRELPEDFFYCVRNIYGHNGFTAIMYPDVVHTFGKVFGDFYILPSSTEEALFVPSRLGCKVSDLKQMVREVNESIVIGEKVYLCDDVFFYDAMDHRLSRAAD